MADPAQRDEYSEAWGEGAIAPVEPTELAKQRRAQLQSEEAEFAEAFNAPDEGAQ